MSGPRFGTLDAVSYGTVEQVTPGIRRVIAENPSKYTYRGTGTYVVGHGDVAVIDPGPDLESHRAALAAALRGERVVAIAATHCHADHSSLASWLHGETDAPRFGAGPHPRPSPAELEMVADDHPAADELVDDPIDWDFVPDETVADGAAVAGGAGWSLVAVHTPGHTSNHVCYALPEEGVLFSGDHVMGWSTTVVSPPDGDMAMYIESLHKVAGRPDARYWPTHGPAIDSPGEFVEALIRHRHEREEGVLRCLRDGRDTVAAIVAELYADVRHELHRPAGRSVLAHLVKLVDEGRVAVTDAPTPRLTAHFAVV